MCKLSFFVFYRQQDCFYFQKQYNKNTIYFLKKMRKKIFKMTVSVYVFMVE